MQERYDLGVILEKLVSGSAGKFTLSRVYCDGFFRIVIYVKGCARVYFVQWDCVSLNHEKFTLR